MYSLNNVKCYYIKKKSARINYYFMCWTRFVVEFKKKFKAKVIHVYKRKNPVVSRDFISHLLLYSNKIKISAKFSIEYLTFLNSGKILCKCHRLNDTICACVFAFVWRLPVRIMLDLAVGTNKIKVRKY